LPCDSAHRLLHDPLSLWLVVGLLFHRLEFMDGLSRLLDDIFMLRQFGFAPDAGVWLEPRWSRRPPPGQ
jgi:hypothetical protein